MIELELQTYMAQIRKEGVIMKNSKTIQKSLLILLPIFLLTLFCVYYINTHSIIEYHRTYAREASDPKWAFKNSDMIIIGRIVGNDTPQKGIQAGVGKKEVIYTDTNVKIEQVLKTKSKQISTKPGDTIAVRTIGGTVDNLAFKADTDEIFIDNDTVLLCLVDGIKSPELPETNNKPYYSLVGGINGVYSLTIDRSKSINSNTGSMDQYKTAKRNKINDVYNFSDLLKLIKETN